MIDYNNYANYSKLTVFIFALHLVEIGEYVTHFPELLYILSLIFSKDGARNIKQLLFLHTVLKREANPNPNKIDIIILPV
jgi:predicted RNase H-like HicB family nuclease